jgi:hypothetical protein
VRLRLVERTVRVALVGDPDLAIVVERTLVDRPGRVQRSLVLGERLVVARATRSDDDLVVGVAASLIGTRSA